MNLSDAFPYEVDELIERAIAPYRPVLSHLVISTLRNDLATEVVSNDSFALVVNTLGAAAQGARPEVSGLDLAQVSLLGGSAAARVVDGAVTDLGLRLEEGSEEGFSAAQQILLDAFSCVSDLAEHHPPPPVCDAAAAAHALTAFLELAVPAVLAAIVGTLFDQQHAERTEAGEPLGDAGNHFVWLLQAFVRVELKGEDFRTFRAYYEKRLPVEGVAEHLGRPLVEELARRRAFLSRFGPSLAEAVERLTEETGPEPARADMRSSPRLHAYARRIMEKQATKKGP